MAISRRQQVADAVLRRMLRQPKARNGSTVSSVRTPMRDGTVLLGDHFAPDSATPRGTLLIRTPYGRGFPTSALNGRFFAAAGYHVLIQSVRGTFGSGGAFQPMAQETADGQDTVAWLRKQAWFDGRLATAGGSYLGWTQWAILQDPPPELRTAIVYVGPHDFREAVFGTGAFTLGDFLGWTYQVTRQEDGGAVRRVVNTVAAGRRLRPTYAGLPLPEAAEAVLHGRAPWYSEWLAHPDGDDPWWEPYRAGPALQLLDAPVLLVSGWQDLFLQQSIEQYEVLSARGVDVALTVGPWTHLDVASRAATRVTRETMDWLDQHMAGGPAARQSPVSVYRTGEGRWHEMASWPPPSAPAVFRLHPSGTLTLAQPAPAQPAPAQPAPAQPAKPEIPAARNPAQQISTGQNLSGSAVFSPFLEGSDDHVDSALPSDSDNGEAALSDDWAADEAVSFWYDPADPTPSVGGRTLTGSMGVKNNRVLETRSDVRAFTTDPLPTAVDVIGSPVLELAISVDTPHADVFVRLCDVDDHGHARNFSDHLRRLDPAVPAGEVHRLTLTLDPCFHRLLAGHRLRLLIAGGAFPRYARAIDDSGALTPSQRTLHCAGSRLTLPVAGPSSPPFSGAASTTR